jgi:phospholipid/cholesterol/gamma-HCH transport system substrate-binding protein
MVLIATGVGMVFALGVGSPSVPSPYKVRAIFDDAAFAVSGEDVRIAGAPVGSIDSLDVTKAHKAAVTIEIDNPGFVPFHLNGHCTIRPQSLIGEKFVDCTPGSSSTPKLSRIRRGPGAGSYYLPVNDTSSPIDTDIVQDIYRLPVREQFAIILNELGTGLAARGADLNQVIRRANPALRDTDRVLKILAAENRQLAQLSTDSNRVLGPLSQVRNQIADFVIQANRTSVASAARATDEARSFHLLPAFLRQLRPLMADLGNLADQGTPLFKVLTRAGPALGRQYENLASFARATRTSLIALGQSAVEQQPALLATIPLDRRLGRLGTATLPAARSLNTLLTSFDNTGGIVQLMKALFNFTTATNGYDKSGHYLRTEALVGGCSAFALTPAPGCSANFGTAGAADVAAADRAMGPAAAADIARAMRARQKGENRVANKHTGALSGLLSYLIGGSR